MNITELARKLKTTTNQLHEYLPQMGFDIGKRAIKVDGVVANKILQAWGHFQQKIITEQLAAKKNEDECSTEECACKPIVSLPLVINVKDFAVKLNLPVTKVIQVLMSNGILAALNEKIDRETATIIAQDLGFNTIDENESEEIENLNSSSLKSVIESEDPKSLITRPSVVVVMGHVDHGKTKLLDAIRKTNVVEGEAGGITQHIGAYQVTKKMKDTGTEKIITFIDTPGHEAFTTMRSRGAKIADIAILVVAADDGVKPQTVEAVKIIQAAGLPMVVAINKIDKPDANLDKVKRELSDLGLIPEDWGGKTVCVPISAKTYEGIDDLLDVLGLISEIEKDKIVANPNGHTVATVVEAHINKNEGPVATVLVQNGTLHQNDHLIIDGAYYGKVRAMKDYRGKLVKEAKPSQPVKIIGFKDAPIIGYVVHASPTLDKDVDKKVKRSTASAVVVTPKSAMKEGEKSINLILKADTLGSLEAIANSLLKIDHPEVKVKIISKDLGNITSADVLKAEATRGFIAGFHVTSSQTANDIAFEKKVEIKSYKIIYELLDDIRSKIEELISPDIIKSTLGRAKVLAIFRTEHNNMIIGCLNIEGELAQGNKVIIARDGTEIGKGKIKCLKSGKQDINQVASGQEFGMTLESRTATEVGDMLEAYKEETIARKLDD
jgi:translation initiation factor IF-2